MGICWTFYGEVWNTIHEQIFIWYMYMFLNYNIYWSFKNKHNILLSILRRYFLIYAIMLNNKTNMKWLVLFGNTLLELNFRRKTIIRRTRIVVISFVFYFFIFLLILSSLSSSYHHHLSKVIIKIYLKFKNKME